MKKTKKRMKAILKYNKEKALLVKKVVGVNLDSKYLMVRPYNLTTKAIINLKKEFGGSTDLVLHNNVYCIVHEYNCKRCPYKKQCNGKNSLLIKANKRWQRVDKKHKRELKKLGEELEEALFITFEELGYGN